MSCTACATKFSLFKGEKSCPQCGFSFCSKCLSEKAIVKKSGSNKPVAVCRNCALNLATPSQVNNDNKNLSTNNISAVPGTTCGAVVKSTHENFVPKEQNRDKDLQERLNDLRKDRTGHVAVSQTTLEDRLAQLKGLDPNEARAASNIPFRMPVDRRTAAEQSRDLLTQYTEEAAIDNKRPSAAEEIEQRLAKLRGEEYRPKPNPDINPEIFLASSNSAKTNVVGDDEFSGKNLDQVNEMMKNYSNQYEIDAKRELDNLNREKEIQDYLKVMEQKRAKRKQDSATGDQNDGEQPTEEEEDEQEANRQLKRIIDEMRLEEEQEQAEFAECVSSPDEEELPYCCICNEDPILRCIDCDGDLYCRRCFKEGHDKEDEHKVVAYKVKKHKQ